MKRLEEIMRKGKEMLSFRVNCSFIREMEAIMHHQVISISQIYKCSTLKDKQFDNKPSDY